MQRACIKLVSVWADGVQDDLPAHHPAATFIWPLLQRRSGLHLYLVQSDAPLWGPLRALVNSALGSTARKLVGKIKTQTLTFP